MAGGEAAAEVGWAEVWAEAAAAAAWGLAAGCAAVRPWQLP